MLNSAALSPRPRHLAQSIARRLLASASLVGLLTLAGCGGGSGPVGPNQRSAYGYEGAATGAYADTQVATNAVPGLGTQAGEVKKSKVNVRPFIRQRAKDPLEVVALYYNSEDGLAAMLRQPELPRGKGKFISPNRYLEYGLVSPRGKALPGFEAQGRKFVTGEEGDRYALYIRNLTTARLEVVMSVDGLDVIDRQPASFEKRGYILEPGEKLRVQGFRYSTEAIQAFRFGTVSSSLANLRYGPTGATNAGVVGFATFPESTTQPAGYTGGDIQRRDMANPFPKEF